MPDNPEVARGEAVSPSSPRQHLREMLFLAEQSVEGELKVLPGQTWAFHYPQGGGTRVEALQGLLEGRYKPDEVTDRLKPDALVYDTAEIGSLGLAAVSARIRDVSGYVAHYDYPRFAQFVAEMKGRDVDLATLQTLYDGVARSRVQKKMIDAYGSTGREQMRMALHHEADRILDQFEHLGSVGRVLGAAKLNWLADEMHYVQGSLRDETVSRLSDQERKLFEQLKQSYQQYIHEGDEGAYGQMVKTVKKELPQMKLQPPTPLPEVDEAMQELMDELESLMDQIGLPGMPGDPGIPPEDQDEYHTPPPADPGESKEQAAVKPMFEIVPSGTSKAPLVGYYCSGRKSYYDTAQKTWSKKKQLTSYAASLSGDKRQTISGRIDAGLKSLPIPNNYALDIASLEFEGDRPEIFRDQNGCFYVQTKGMSKFSIDFLREEPPFFGPPIAEDRLPLYQGQLSAETEAAIQTLQGTALDKALQARAYIVKNHSYPAGGSAQAAQALQYKLRQGSSGDEYIRNLDQSEYLECYSANTLLVAMLRKSGVPARLVVGHKVERAREGKAAIDATTGHAWSEIWDGSKWVRVDGTPQPKPGERKEGEEKEQPDGTPTEQADDGGVEPLPSEPQAGEQSQDTGATDTFDTSDMSEASDQDVEQGEKQLQEAQETVKEMDQKKSELDQAIEQVETVEDLMAAEKAVEEAELFEEMHTDLEDRLEAKEEQIKDSLKDELAQMVEDGFLDEERRQELEELIDEVGLDDLDKLQQQLEEEMKLYEEYQKLKEEVEPYVERWWEYFVEQLPREEEIEIDEDSRSRRGGAIDRRALKRPRNIMFGTIKHPRIIRPEVKPLFMASAVVDVSGSMGQSDKIRQARKLLVFYNELFSRISEEFGYIRYANYVFSDTASVVKRFDQDYESAERYTYDDGTRSTVKVRLMRAVQAGGGTNMLNAIKQAAADLNREASEYDDYATAFYFFGDGEDTYGNADNIRQFLRLKDSEQGFGEHVLSAILLGDESLRQQLASVFGEEGTSVVKDFDLLIERAMQQFERDIGIYLEGKTI